ncbi:MAG: hypothetical protein WCD69_16785 [Xanthobacteraceae bacterium]
MLRLRRLLTVQRMRLHRYRRRHGIHRRSIDVTDAQLDALEVCGYLDPGDRPDECDAIEMFLGDSLLKGWPSPASAPPGGH